MLPHRRLTRSEFGVGVGAVHFPDYPGAEEVRTLVLPFPYVVMRNRYLDVNRDHIRGKLFKDDRFSLDVDFGGQVSVDSSDTQERRGMPDLDWLGEVGPSLRYHAWRDAEDQTHLDLVLPLRVAVSAQGLTLHHRGWVTGPRAEWHKTLHLAAETPCILTAPSPLNTWTADMRITTTAWRPSTPPPRVRPMRRRAATPVTASSWA